MSKAVITFAPNTAIAGVVLKIGGTVFPIEQLYDKTLYTTKNIKARRPSRWSLDVYENVTFVKGDPLGELESWRMNGGKYELRFKTVTKNVDGKDIIATYGVDYEPGLIELDSIKAQGAKSAEDVVKEQQKKESGGLFDIPNPFEGAADSVNDFTKNMGKYLGITIAVVGGIILLKTLGDNSPRGYYPPPPRY